MRVINNSVLHISFLKIIMDKPILFYVIHWCKEQYPRVFDLDQESVCAEAPGREIVSVLALPVSITCGNWK